MTCPANSFCMEPGGSEAIVNRWWIIGCLAKLAHSGHNGNSETELVTQRSLGDVLLLLNA